MKCSLSFFPPFKEYSAYRRENCKDISSWLPSLHDYISAERLSYNTRRKQRGGETEEKWWSPAAAVVWMFYRWKDEKEMKPCSTSMLILFLKYCFRILFSACQISSRYPIWLHLTPSFTQSASALSSGPQHSMLCVSSSDCSKKLHYYTHQYILCSASSIENNISMLLQIFSNSSKWQSWITLSLVTTNLLIQSPLEMRWGSALEQGHCLPNWMIKKKKRRFIQ